MEAYALLQFSKPSLFLLDFFFQDLKLLFLDVDLGLDALFSVGDESLRVFVAVRLFGSGGGFLLAILGGIGVWLAGLGWVAFLFLPLVLLLLFAILGFRGVCLVFVV